MKSFLKSPSRITAVFAMLLTVSAAAQTGSNSAPPQDASLKQPAPPPPGLPLTPLPAPTGTTPTRQTPAPDNPEEDILPIRAAVEIPGPQPTRVWTWVLLAAGLLAAALLWRWWHRPRRQSTPAPLEAALMELAAIDRVRNELEAAPLADQTAGTVRRFIQARHGIAAPRQTTEEFLRSLTTSKSVISPSQELLLRQFLMSCDMAKFAGAQFDPIQRLALLEAAGKFVRDAARETAPPAPPSAAPRTPAPTGPTGPTGPNPISPADL